MKNAVLVIGVLLIIGGAVWLLQGLNVLPGSVMTGQPFWAWAGLAAVMGGIVLLLVGLGRRV